LILTTIVKNWNNISNMSSRALASSLSNSLSFHKCFLNFLFKYKLFREGYRQAYLFCWFFLSWSQARIENTLFEHPFHLHKCVCRHKNPLPQFLFCLKNLTNYKKRFLLFISINNIDNWITQKKWITQKNKKRFLLFISIKGWK
jgi:hypothetical protein